jgi:hypothetical protein
MNDRTMKVLLAVIALGIWANVLVPVFKAVPAVAQGNELSKINLNLAAIYNGTCANHKIC